MWIIFIVIVFLRKTVTESQTRERVWQELSSINIGPKGDIRSPLGATIFFFQNGRDLDDYVREYVDKCHLATFDDLTLIEGFWCGLEDHIRFVMPRADLCWSLRNYINFALWIARSAFSVDEAETSPVSSHVDGASPPSVADTSLPAAAMLSPPAAARSSSPAAAHASPQLTAAASLTLNQKRNKMRKRLLSAPELTPVSAPVCISDLLDMALPPEFSVPILTPESIQRRSPSSPKSPLVPSSFLRLLSLRWTQPAPLLPSVLQCLIINHNEL